MLQCRNCGKLNAMESHFCRFCGTRMGAPQTQPPSVAPDPYGHSAPRPYAWKTDDLPSTAQARRTDQINRVEPFAPAMNQPYGGAPLAYAPAGAFAMPFRCPQCMSQMIPRIERRISTAGWITFAVLLVFFFPLFWIGLLIKEDVHVCQACNSRIQVHQR